MAYPSASLGREYERDMNFFQSVGLSKGSGQQSLTMTRSSRRGKSCNALGRFGKYANLAILLVAELL